MMATTRRPPCAYQGPTSSAHSSDRVTVWHGAPTPLVVCGYHAGRSDIMAELYAAKAAARLELPPTTTTTDQEA